MKATSIQVKDVAVRRPRTPKVQSPAIDPKDAFLLEVLKQGASLDQMQRLIDMRNAEQERQAKLSFDEHFAEMQRDFTEIHAKRVKQGHNYKYAPIEVLVNAYGPTIAKHGFSFRWGKEKSLDGGGKQSLMYVSGFGHTEEITFDLPKLDGTSQMNPIQVAGAMSSYGHRYTFLAGFGITVEDEDTDGNLTFEDGVKYAAEVALIREAKDMDELAADFKLLYQKLDNEGRQIISREKDKRKKELSK